MILIRDCGIIPMTGPEDNISRGFIVTDGEHILEVGSGKCPAEHRFEKVIEADGMVAIPGLVNSHTHAAMSLFRGYADDLPLREWLNDMIWPMEAKLTPEYCYWGTMLGIAEMIRSGTTCFADMYFHMDQVGRAVDETGIRACLSQGMIAFDDGEGAFLRSRQLFDNWHQQAGGRIKVMLGPHAPYTCPPDYLKRVVALSDQLGIGIHTHLSETKGEYDDILSQYGMSPVALMRETGLFQRPVLAAHCVALNDDDIGILARYGVGVAHNPESNMKLASGVARIPDMLAAGVQVGLGTDGASSNNNLDMIQEMRSASFLQKVHCMDPQVMPAYQVLEMATVKGAQALGYDDTGMIKPGMKADITIINLNRPHLRPHTKDVALLVYSASGSDVDTVLVNGRVLLEKGALKTIDEQKVMDQAEIAFSCMSKGK